MGDRLGGVVAAVAWPLFAPLLLMLRVSGAWSAVQADAQSWLGRIEAWKEYRPRSPRVALLWLLLRPEFRALALYRLRSTGIPGWALAKVAGLAYRGPAALYLDCPRIGPGLWIEHGFATVVNADRVGEDCWFNQQVTIGYGAGGGRPTLGDRVQVRAGAIVIGGIHVGDDAVIGAGAVVTKDVPSGHVALGPAATIRPLRPR